MNIDLGCGKGKRAGCVGVDRVGPPITDADVLCHFGFQRLPFDDGSVGEAFSQHSIEHIPFKIYSMANYHASGPEVYRPVLFLLQEVYRVLSPGGTFWILTLPFPDPRCFEDPDHCSIWTVDTIRHFIPGARPDLAARAEDESAGLHVPFQLCKSGLTSDLLLEILLRKPGP